MTKNELKDLIHTRYNLLEDGEGDASVAADAGGAAGDAGSSPMATTTSNISSSSDISSDQSYNKDDVLFGGGNGPTGDDSFGGVSGGSGDVAPFDNPFQDDKIPDPEMEEPARYEVLGFLEKDPEYPDEKDYIKVRDIKTKEIKIFPLSQIDLA